MGTQGGGGSVLAVPILVYVLARHVRRRGGQVAEGVGRRQRRGGLGAGRRDLSRRCASPSLITLVTHLAAGRSIGVAVTVAMAGGAGAGELGGATVAGRVPQRTLGRGFAGLVVAVAGYLLVSATVLGGPPGS